MTGADMQRRALVALPRVVAPWILAATIAQAGPPLDPRVLDDRVTERVDAGFAGSVVVARGDKILLHRSYGPDGSTDGREEPAYWIGSNSKQFTGALLSILAAEGKIDLDARIGRYLEKVPKKKQEITVRQLLTHSSGLAHAYAADGVRDRTRALRAILGVRLVDPPGTRYSYSNDGYNLLAILAEIVTGESFEQLLRSRILEAVGLSDTGPWGFEGERPIAPVFNDERLRSVGERIYADGRSRPNWGYRGSTGLYSTAKDLYIWLRRLQEARSKDSDPLARIQTGQQFVRERDGSTISYGFGIAVVERDGELQVVRHTGDEDWLGHNSVVLGYADGDIIVVLSNAGYLDGRGWSSVVARDLIELLGK